MIQPFTPGTEIASGIWENGSQWRTTFEVKFPPELQANPRLCSAAGVVVLYHTSDSLLPDVIMTRRDIGRHGKQPEFEIPFGHRDPIDPANPKGELEPIPVAAIRETDEEAGVILSESELTLFAICRIINPPGSNYKTPLSFMAYYYARAERWGIPSEAGHTSKHMTLGKMGELARLSPEEAAKEQLYRVNPTDAKFVRVAALTCLASWVDEAIGPLAKPGTD
ncbi:MAG TPA: NUDIX domain-containing protein [Candidatus Saccharimonadales bacterium]|nr:NUDIX domain-containing protein [Candidatus Saccharimonadales bacterium]